MQKKLIALAIAGLASSAAFAQSNVTVYGIVDAGMNVTDYDGAAKSTTAVHGGGLATSRIGFKGAEDLGNGLKAIFTLEYALYNDVNSTIGATAGASSTTFNARQSLVGLSDAKFGTVVLGRLQTVGWGFAAGGTALGGSTALGANYLAGSNVMLSASGRSDNAVAYVSPTWNGVSFELNHGRLTETAGSTGVSDAYANLVGLNYANGPLTAGIAYSKLSDITTTVTLGGISALGTKAVNGSDVTEWGLRAGYDFKVAKLQAAYTNLKGETNAGTYQDDDKYVLSVTVPVTAKGAIIGEYANVRVKYDNLAAGGNADRNVWSVAYKHDLSKRTALYAGYAAVNTDSANSATAGDYSRLAAGVTHAF